MTTLSDATRISRASFHRLVVLHLRMRQHDPDERELDEWLACLWPHIEDDMNPARWAQEYLSAMMEMKV